MIGNDIIDLQYTKETCDYKRSGFLQKILTKEEQALVYESSDPFLLVWRMWSMKESAYKIHVQNNQSRVLNPKSFDCKIVDDSEGTVSINEHTYYSQSTIETNYIFTCACQQKSSQARHNISVLKNSDHHHQSLACRNSLIEDVARLNNWDIAQLELRKSGIGRPELYNNQSKVDIDISLTHHGCYAGFSFAAPLYFF